MVGSGVNETARLAIAASLGPPSTAHFHILADSASGLQLIGTQNQTALASSGLNNNAGGTPSNQVGDFGMMNSDPTSKSKSSGDGQSASNGVHKIEANQVGFVDCLHIYRGRVFILTT